MWKDKSIRATIIIGLIGIIITVLLSVFPKSKRDPVFAFVKSPSLIYDHENSKSKLKVLLEDSLLVKTNVYVTTIAVWNKGGLPINPEDIRAGFVFKFNDTIGTILDYKVLTEVSAIKPNFLFTNLGNSVEVGWKYFDPDDGFLIQLTYLGRDSTEILLHGSALRAEVKEVTYISNESLKLRTRYLISTFISIVFFFWFIYYQKYMPHEFAKKVVTGILIFVYTMLIITFLFFAWKTLGGISPPF